MVEYLEHDFFDKKQSMELLAAKEGPCQLSDAMGTTVQKSYTIDRDCISCSGHSPMILQIFKAACINYQPSIITYRNKEIDHALLF